MASTARKLVNPAPTEAPKTTARATKPAKKSTPKLSIVAGSAKPSIDFTWKAALDNARSCTFLCDTNWNITYANKKSIEVLNLMEPNLHAWDRSWQSFSVATIIGTNLDFLFTDDKAEFRKASAPGGLPYQGIVRTGPCTCDISIAEVRDEKGHVTGYAVDWERITEKLAKEREITRLLAALDGANTNVMMTDTDLKLIYMNQKSSDTLKSVEGDLKSVYGAGFRVEELMGKCIDEFHKNPAYQRGLLKKGNMFPHDANIQIGPLTLHLVVSQILDKNGEPMAYTAEWEEISAKIKQEQEVARLISALDGANTNIMMIDTNLNMIYMNKKSSDTLKAVEPDLKAVYGANFNVNDLMGKCIDSFHKNPEYQRGLLRKGSMFPHSAQIQIGPLTLSLVISEVKDSAGEPIAYTAEWQDITAKLAEEKRQAEELEEKRYLTRKLEEMTDISVAIAGGDLTQTIHIEKDDLVGKLSTAFNSMVGSLKHMADAAEQIANGNLAVSVTPQSEKDQLGNAFEQMIQNLSQLIAQARGAADSISVAAGEVMTGNDDLSQRTEEQAASLEETAASMQEMTSTVKQSADNARQANQLAFNAREVAEKGGQVVGNAVTTMEEINKASKRIADIISVIDEIAFQTNLLALNAAVEAARVGEQGRGFAVVAAEVRNLAGRSATAAKEIKALVQDSVGKVQEGSDLVNQSGTQLEEIVNSVKKVADIISEIAAAAQEQSTGIEQVNKAIIQMDQITQQNAALVEEASAASQSMNTQAQGLKKVVGQFTLGAGFNQEAPAATFTAPAPKPAAPARPTVPAQQAAPAAASARSASARLTEDNEEFEEF